MANNCNNNITVESLPIKQSALGEDYLLLYNSNVTSRIKVSDLVLGAENFDFYPEIVSIINTLENHTSILNPGSANWTETYNTVQTNSAAWNSLNSGIATQLLDQVADNYEDWNDVTTTFKLNSATWEETTATLNLNSDRWDTIAAIVETSQARWDSAYAATRDGISAIHEALEEIEQSPWYTYMYGGSGSGSGGGGTGGNLNQELLGEIYTTMFANSTRWSEVDIPELYEQRLAAVYTNVSTSSAQWNTPDIPQEYVDKITTLEDQITVVNDNSDKWIWSYNTVFNNHTDWTSTYNTVQTFSGEWKQTRSKMVSTSATWDNVASIVLGDHENWTDAYERVTADATKWDSAYTRIQSSANFWDTAYSIVNTKSDNWDAAYDRIVADADDWSTTYTTVITRSPKWEETYLKVLDDGPDWDDTYVRVRDYHQNWDDTYDRVVATGDDWDGVYLTVQTNSADWFSPPEIINLVTNNSGMWNGAWSFVHGDSATNNTNYNRSVFVNASGDTIDGNLDINGELTVFGDMVFGDPTEHHEFDHTPENTEHLTLQNVRDFKEIQTVVVANSTVWLTPPELTALVNANSGMWDGAYSFVNSDSATNNTDYNRSTFVNVSGDTMTGALSVQDDVVVDHKLYVLDGEIVLGDGVHSHEHIHEPQETESFTLYDIRDFKSTYTSVSTTSASWDSVYTSVNENSAVWFSPPELTALVNANSGMWNGAYNFVHSDSATNNTNYNRTTFLNVSGDTMLGELSATEDVILDKGLFVLSGTIIFGDGIEEHDWIHDPDAIEPLTIHDVRHFKSVEASVFSSSSSWDDVYNTVNVNSGVWFTPPDLTALVNSNSAKWISTHTSVNETSGEWDSVYDSVLATSAEWDAVYNFVNADSATNNTNYNQETFVNVTGDTMTGDLTVAGMVSATEGVFTSLTAISSVISVIDIRARELSGYEIIDGDLDIEEELHVKGRVGIESELNLINGEIYFGDGTYDHDKYHNENLLEKLSKKNVQDFKSTHISVLNTSGDWDAVYAFVNADSATNNTDYNRTTFVNVTGDTITGTLSVGEFLHVHEDINVEHGSIWFGHQHFDPEPHHLDAEEFSRQNVIQFKSTYGSVLTTSATWDSVYTSVLATSSNWDSTHASVFATSSNWDSTHASVFATSSNWDSTHASVLATSSNWDSTHTSVHKTSGEWDAVYAFVNADSATNNTNYNRNTFVNVSGDTITGDLTVEGKTELLGGLNVQGLLSGGEAFFTSLTALSSYVNVIDIKVRELSGYEIIDGELVVHDDITAAHNLFVTEGAIIFGDSGVNHGIPHNPAETEALTKQDVRNFKSTYLSVLGTSGEWDSVYNSVLTTSADWNSVYSFVNTDSATNNTNYNRNTFVNVSGDTITGELSVVQDLSVYDDLNVRGGDIVFGNPYFHNAFHQEELETLSRENVREFKSTHASVLATSGNWDSTHASVFNTSGEWDSVYTSVLTTSANWDSTHTSVFNTSGEWDSVYASVLATSANWDSTHASVFATSSNWDSTHASVLATSANWDSTHASVFATSGEWDAVYAFVNADSGTNNTNYNRTVFVNASGDIMTGDLTVQTNVITENIKTSSPTKTLSLYGGTGVDDGAHIKIFGGNQGDSTKDNRILLNTDDLYVGDVHDIVDGPEPWMFRVLTDDKKVVIGGIEPNSNNMLTVSGSSFFRDNVTVSADISAKGDIYLSKSSLIFSDGDNRDDEIWTAVDSVNSKSTHTSVQATSGEWDAVYTFVNADSATNNTIYNRDSYVNVTGDKMTGDLEIVGTLSASNGIFTSLTALSTVINVIDIKARELSGYDIIDGDLRIEEELHVGKRIESTNDINLINGQILFGDGTWDHDQYHNPQLLEELNRQDVVQFKSTYTSVKPNSANWVSTHLSVLANSANWMSTHQSVLTTSATWDSVYDSVLATSGEWDAVYAFVNADSATNNTNYNRTTFVNASGDTITGELSVVQDLSIYSDLNVRDGDIVFGNPYFHDAFHADELESLTRENVREFKSTHLSVFNTSGNWDSVYASVLTTSSNWDSTHLSVFNTSGNWDSVYDSVLATSGEWDAVYAFVNSDSATNNTDYNRNTFVNVSGDTITGTLSVKDEVSFDVNLNMYNGEIVFGNPYFHDAFHADELESLTRENVREFKSTYNSVLTTSGLWDSVYHSVLTTSGEWDSVYDSVLTTSGLWDSVYDSVLTTSGEWDAVYAFVNADSATNNTNYNRTTFVNASGDTMTGDLTVDANIINTGYIQTDTIAGNDPTSHVNIFAGTGENDGAYIELYGSNNADSTNDGRIRIHGEEILIGDIYDVADGYNPWTLKIDTDNNNIVIGGQTVIDDSVLTVLGKTTIDGTLNITSDSSIQGSLTVTDDISAMSNIILPTGHIVFDDETLMETDVQHFKSTHTSVHETSGEWDAVYAFVNADSATNNTNYNRNTFVNVSGDTMTGDLTVNGTVSATSAIFSYLTALSTVINVVDIKARELSGYDIIDGDLKIEEELYVGERIESTGDINITTGQILFGDGTWDHDQYHNYHLLEELNRQDVVEFKSTYNSVLTTSGLWDSVYDSVLTTSGLWDSVYDSVLTTSGYWDAVYAFVNADSATNNTNYNRNTFVNVSGDTITGELSVVQDLSIYEDFNIYNGEIIFGNPYYHDAFHADELESLTRENVREFKSTHNSVFTTSGLWDSVYDSVCATSALWDSVYDSVLTTSGEWDSVYDSVCATSALWDSVYDSVLTTSGLWDSVYDSVLTTSGLWDSVYDSVLTTSGYWDAVYAFVNADSATNNTNYNRNTFVNVSGDTMTGDLTVEGIITGHTLKTANPTTHLQLNGGNDRLDGSAIELYGTNNTNSTYDGRMMIFSNDIYIGEIYDDLTGYGPWLVRYDVDDQQIIFGGTTARPGSLLTVKGASFFEDDVTVSADISAKGDIYLSKSSLIFSDGDNRDDEVWTATDSVNSKSTHTSVTTTSGNWDSVYSYTQSDSATNNTNYNWTHFVNTSGDTMTGDLTVNGTVSATSAIFSYLTALSTVINVVDIKARELSGYDIIDGDLKIEEELYVGERIESTNDINLINGQILFGDGTWDHDQYHNYHLLEELNRQDVVQFKSTYDSVLSTSGLWDSVYDSVLTTSGLWDSVYDSVLTTSGYWDSVYSFVNTDSATNNTNYNRTTFVNVTGDTITGELSVNGRVAFDDNLNIWNGEIIFGNPYYHDAFHAWELESLTRENVREFKSTHNSVLTTSGEWDSVYDSVCATSGLWDSVYDSVLTTSGEWDSVYDSVCATSGLWNSVYNFVNADSGTNNTNYNRTTFVNVTGDTITGMLSVTDEIITNDDIHLTHGEIWFGDTHFEHGVNHHPDESESLTKQDVRNFKSTHLSVLETSGEWDSVYHSVCTTSGNWDSTHLSVYNNSANWDSVYNSVLDTSAEWDAVYAFVNADSATNNTNYNRTTFVNASGDTMDGDLVLRTQLITQTIKTNDATKSLKMYGGTDLDDGAGITLYGGNQNNSNYDNRMMLHADHIFVGDVFDVVDNNDPWTLHIDIDNNETIIGGLDSIENSTLTVQGKTTINGELRTIQDIIAESNIKITTGHILFDDETLMETDVQHFKSTHTSVFETSAEWDAVYAFVNADSATNNTNYNRTTFVNASGDTVNGDITINGKLSATEGFFTTLTALSTIINVVDIRARELSGYEIIDGTLDIEEELHVGQRIEAKDDINLISGSIIFGQGHWGTDCYHDPANLEYLTKQNVIEFKSTYASVCATSGLWDSVYDSVCATSGLWDSVYDSVLTTSGFWDSVYDSVCATSGLWDSVYDSVLTTSAQWDAVYAFVNADSATNNTNYNRNTFVNVSGDRMTGSLEVDGNTTVHGDLIVDGNVYFNSTSDEDGVTVIYLGDEDTDSIIFNADVDSSINPDKNMTYDLGSFDKHWNETYTHNICAFGNGAVRNDFLIADGMLIFGDEIFEHGHIHVPGEKETLTKYDVRDFKSTYNSVLTTSALWDSVYDSVCATSALWDSVYDSVCATSALWDSVYDSVCATSALWDSVYDSVCATSALWDSVYDSVCATSGLWDSVYDSVCATSAQWDAVYAFVNADSATNNTNYNRNTFVNVSGDHITGDLEIDGNTIIHGDLTVDGNAYLSAGVNGIINVGNENTDNVIFHADVDSNIIPNQEMTFDLGTIDQRWNNLYIHSIDAKQNVSVAGETNLNQTFVHDILSGGDVVVSDLTAHNNVLVKGTTDLNHLNITGLLSGVDAVFSSMTALSTVVDVIDIKVRELSGYDIIDGDLRVDGRTTTDMLLLTQSDDPFSLSNPGWQISQFTGDGDSGVGDQYVYTHAVNVYGTTDYKINGIDFIAETTGSAPTWEITTGVGDALNQEQTSVTGNVGDMISDRFRYIVDTQKIILKDLIISKKYVFTLYVQAWSTDTVGKTAELSSTANDEIVVVSQNEYINDTSDGMLINYVFIANDNTVEFTFNPTDDSSWNFYAFSNREVWGYESESLVASDVSNFKSTYNTVLTTSGRWESVYNFVNADSATNNTDYNRSTFVNVSGDTMTGALSVMSDLDIDGVTTLTGNLTAESNVYIQGDLRVDGNVWLLSDVDSHLYLGESEDDVVLFQAPVDSNITPLKPSERDLGDSDHSWRRIYVDEIVLNTSETLEETSFDMSDMKATIEVNSVVQTTSADWNESYTQAQYLTAATNDLSDRVESLYHYTVSNFDKSVVTYQPTLQEFINDEWQNTNLNVGDTVVVAATNKVFVLVETDGSLIENWIEVNAKPNNLFYRANANHTDIIDTFGIDKFRSAKYIVEVEGDGELMFTELTMVTNGRRVFLTEYGMNYTTENPFVQFDATLNNVTSAAELRIYQVPDSGERAWTPDDLQLKPLTWLDASNADKVVVDSNNIFNRWENSGATDLRMVSFPGAEPEYVTDGDEQLNGLNVLKFTNGSDFLESDYVDGSSKGKWDGDPVVWFAVFKPTDINNFHDYMLWFKQYTDDDNNIEPIAIVPGDNDEFFGQVWMGDNTQGKGSYPLNQPYSYTDLSNQWNIYELELDPLNGTVSMYLNGRTIQQGAPMSYKFPKDAEHTFRMHANWIGSEFTDGYFAEFLVIPNYQRQKVEGYLAHKWGISDNLPVDHIYKDMAPYMKYTVKGNRTNLF